MIKLFTGAVRALHGFLGSSWYVLIALAAVAGWFYADARRVRADRDAWASWGAQVCAFTGTTTHAATVEIDTNKGKRRVAKERGQLCAEAAQDLASFKAQTTTNAADILGKAQAEREGKATADAAAASRDAADRGRATTKMEKLDEQLGNL